MLLSDLTKRTLKHFRYIAFAMPILLGGCQIHPLYSDSNVSVAAAQSIGFEPVTNRVEQTVRNRLIFLLSGGAGEPSSPRYNVQVIVGGSAVTYLLSTATADTYPGRLLMEGSFTVTDTATNQVVYNSKQSLVSLRDITKQQFANIRATRDAEDRAANEMAERIRAEIVTHLDSQGLWQK